MMLLKKIKVPAETAIGTDAVIKAYLKNGKETQKTFLAYRESDILFDTPFLADFDYLCYYEVHRHIKQYPGFFEADDGKLIPICDIEHLVVVPGETREMKIRKETTRWVFWWVKGERA